MRGGWCQTDGRDGEEAGEGRIHRQHDPRPEVKREASLYFFLVLCCFFTVRRDSNAEETAARKDSLDFASVLSFLFSLLLYFQRHFITTFSTSLPVQSVTSWDQIPGTGVRVPDVEASP